MSPARDLDWRDVFEQSSARSAVLLPDLTIVSVTDGFARCFGQPRSSVLGRPLLDLLEELEVPQLDVWRASFERIRLTRAGDRFEVASCAIGTDSGHSALGVVNTPIFDGGGNLSCIRHDLEMLATSPSDEQVASGGQGARVAILEERVEELNRELESFAHSVSHDLRAPLRAMDGFGRLLLADYGDKLEGEGREFLEQVCTGAVRMSGLLDDLLTLSRIGRASMRHVDVDLSGIARRVVDDLVRKEPGRSVAVDIAPNVHVIGDPRLLTTALEQLLGNAWKFTRPRAEARIAFGVELTGAEPPSYFVRDNGTGFDMKYAGKLFNPFQRMHGADFEGRGVGLAVVRRIITRHGGRVWPESTRDQGATFRFTLAASRSLELPAPRVAASDRS